MTLKEAYELNIQVINILNSKDYNDDIKKKLKKEAMLEPLSMLASCYDKK